MCFSMSNNPVNYNILKIWPNQNAARFYTKQTNKPGEFPSQGKTRIRHQKVLTFLDRVKSPVFLF